MKNLMMIVILIFISLFVISCENQSMIENNEKDMKSFENSISMDTNGIIHDIGIKHNLCLDFIKSNYLHNENHFEPGEIINDDIYIKRVYFDSTLILVENYMQINGYSSSEITNLRNTINSLFANANMFVEINNKDYVKPIQGNLQSIENAAQAMDIVEQTEYTIIDSIIYNIDNLNLNVADSLIQSIDLNNYNLSTDNSFFVIKSIYSYSKEYWTAYYNERNIEFINYLDPAAAAAVDAIASKYGIGVWKPFLAAFYSFIQDLGSDLLEELIYPEPCCPVCDYYGV